MVVVHQSEEGFNFIYHFLFNLNLLCLVILVQQQELIAVLEWRYSLQTKRSKDDPSPPGNTGLLSEEKSATTVRV